MGEKVFIITRRFCNESDSQSEKINGIGVEIEKDKDYIKHLISNRFIEFWARALFYNSKIKNEHEDVVAFYDYLKLDNTEAKFRDFFNQLKHINDDESEHLAKIYEYIPDEKQTNIFVYRHWLNNSSQGFEQKDTKMDFLSYLKNNVVEILKSNERYDGGNELSFNWLIHDKDIFDYTKSGLFCFDKKIYDPNLVQNIQQSEEILTHLHSDLHSDNIWLFTHANHDPYFANIILNPQNKRWTADSLYNYLVVDEKGCKRRIIENGWNDEDIMTIGMIKKILEIENPYPEFSISDLTGKTIGEFKNRLNKWL